MNFNYLDKDDYKNIAMVKMADNNHGGLPFFIRRYTIPYATNTLHRHEFIQINYISRGKGKHLVNKQEFDIIKGDIFVIPPYVPHLILSSLDDSELEVYEFEFEASFINQYLDSIENTESFMDFAYIEPFLVSESQVKPRLNLVGKAQIETEILLNEALKEYNEKASGYILIIKSILLKLLVMVGREFKRDIENSDTGLIFNRHKDAIMAALKHIELHYAEEINLDDIAKMFLFSQSYFSYLFKNITSKTFVEYLNGIRISRAMELLKKTDRRVLDICYDVGFKNVNHFNRIFRQHTGLSPLVYRKSPI